ncbi:MAG: hypothetical protein IJA80_00625 [Clostridia bacterium]|nr:hypothetical protein [Clostridia bacterium]
MSYTIKNPYENVMNLLGDMGNHYKTNLHTHSTYSDANDTMTDMIKGFYDNDFDIVAFAEHGILGKPWNEEPTHIPFFNFQYLWHGKRSYLTQEQYKAIKNGTYKTENGTRTKTRGLEDVPNAIECNMFTIMKNHVNGYFTDNAYEGVQGLEFDYEIPLGLIEKSGGISHINHPTDLLQSWKRPDCANKPENIHFFANLLNKYPSCMGIEVLNMYDIPNRCDRILWDELLKLLTPHGRKVFGFANSDAHQVDQIDTAFMDFILPEYSLDNLRKAMETGTFFSIARYAKNELGEDFVGHGPTPKVVGLSVDDENDIITIKGVNCKEIDWIADGDTIKTTTIEKDGEITSTIELGEYTDKISCYVRAQLKGQGGICLTQAFILDDGNMESLKQPIIEEKLTEEEKKKRKFYSKKLGVVYGKLMKKI